MRCEEPDGERGRGVFWFLKIYRCWKKKKSLDEWMEDGWIDGDMIKQV